MFKNILNRLNVYSFCHKNVIRSLTYTFYFYIREGIYISHFYIHAETYIFHFDTCVGTNVCIFFYLFHS